MFTLDISGKNRELFDGMVGIPSDIHHINIQGQHGYNIVFKNVTRIVKALPQNKRSEILISGVAPRWVALAAVAAATPYFKKVRHFDGKDTIVLYSSPPSDLPPCSEAEG